MGSEGTELFRKGSEKGDLRGALPEGAKKAETRLFGKYGLGLSPAEALKIASTKTLRMKH